MRSIRLAVSGTLVAGLGYLAASHAAGAGIAGDYRIHGKNPDGRPYDGSLHIEQRGAVYALTWDSGGIAHGTGLLRDGKLVVGYNDVACGVVAYKKKGEGILDGAWATANSTQLGSELATRAPSSESGLSGDYVVSGRNADGTEYKGALFVNQDGDSDKLSLTWRTGPDARGFALQSDGLIAGTFGPPTCGVVVYSVASDGGLFGQWSMAHGGLGTEVAQKAD